MSEHLESSVSGFEAGEVPPGRPIPEVLFNELAQAPETRRALIQRIEQQLDGRRVVTFFTFFRYPVIIDDSDADTLESVLRTTDMTGGLSLILNSPGGDALAAERIIRVCRTYSGGDFEVIVPKAAKSAATMIALGARQIFMSETSELGPIDPQVVWGQQYIPAHAIIDSYETLLREAVNLAPDQRIEPYLQQLDRYDVGSIEQLRKLRDLSTDIARQSLRTGMLREKNDAEIDECVQLFTEWDKTFTHGRPIFPDVLTNSGLDIRILDSRSDLWDVVFELYVRTDYYVSTVVAKSVEASHTSLVAYPPQ